MLISFADDTELNRIANTLENRNKIQSDLDGLKITQLNLTTDKCQVLRLGNKNQIHRCRLSLPGLITLEQTKSLKSSRLQTEYKPGLGDCKKKKKQVQF